MTVMLKSTFKEGLQWKKVVAEIAPDKGHVGEGDGTAHFAW